MNRLSGPQQRGRFGGNTLRQCLAVEKEFRHRKTQSSDALVYCWPREREREDIEREDIKLTLAFYDEHPPDDCKCGLTTCCL